MTQYVLYRVGSSTVCTVCIVWIHFFVDRFALFALFTLLHDDINLNPATVIPYTIPYLSRCYGRLLRVAVPHTHWKILGMSVIRE